MHAGSYGLTPADGPAPPAGPAERRRAWHGRSGRAWCRRWPRVSPSGRTRCPASRPRWYPAPWWRWSPARTAGSAPDWPGSSGKTQLASYLAGSLWRSRGVDLLAWVNAASRASVLSGYVAGRRGAGPG